MIMVILGGSGCGKSSLMKILVALMKPSSGKVLIDGKDIQKHRKKLRSYLGYLPQDFGVYPKTSAEDLLNHFAVLKGLTDRKQRASTRASSGPSHRASPRSVLQQTHGSSPRP